MAGRLASQKSAAGADAGGPYDDINSLLDAQSPAARAPVEPPTIAPTPPPPTPSVGNVTATRPDGKVVTGTEVSRGGGLVTIRGDDGKLYKLGEASVQGGSPPPAPQTLPEISRVPDAPNAESIAAKSFPTIGPQIDEDALDRLIREEIGDTPEVADDALAEMVGEISPAPRAVNPLDEILEPPTPKRVPEPEGPPAIDATGNTTPPPAVAAASEVTEPPPFVGQVGRHVNPGNKSEFTIEEILPGDKLLVSRPDGWRGKMPSSKFRPSGGDVAMGVLGGGAGLAAGTLAEGEQEDGAPTQAGISPILGAILGMAAGPAAGRGVGASMLGKAFAGTDWGNTASNLYRGNLLTSKNLLSNAFAAPWGTTALTGAEEALTGILEKNPNTKAMGMDILKQAKPSNFFDPTAYHKNRKWSQDTITNAGRAAQERADFTPGATSLNPIDRLSSQPAVLMTTMDKRARDAMQGSGERFGKSRPEAEQFAREATMTGTPKWGTSRALVDFQNAHPIAKFALPFAKTTTQVVEGGVDRTPGLGLLTERARRRDPSYTPKTSERMMAEQGLGAGVGAAGFGAGLAIDETDVGNSKQDAMAKLAIAGLIRNATGRYSLPATIGLASGMAAAKGDNPLTALFKGVGEAGTEYPLPTGKPLAEGLRTGSRLSEEGMPKDIDELLALLPSGAIPGLVRDVYKWNQ